MQSYIDQTYKSPFMKTKTIWWAIFTGFCLSLLMIDCENDQENSADSAVPEKVITPSDKGSTGEKQRVTESKGE